MRWLVLDFTSADYTYYLSLWYDKLQGESGFGSLVESYYNYTPTYLYLLFGMSLTSIHKLYAIKLISFLFEVVAAGCVFTLLRPRFPSARVPLMGAVAFLFHPTVFMNSAFWAQCDIIYTTFVLLTLVAILRGWPLRAVLAFGTAFALKVQALWILPVLALLCVHNFFLVSYLLIIPAMYLVAILPVALMGRPWLELITIYTRQADTNPAMTLNAANMYQLFPLPFAISHVALGIVFTAAVVIGLVLWASRNVSLDKILKAPGELLTLSYFFALVVPFLLPKMHDRFFFMADVLAFIVAFHRKALIVPAFLSIAASCTAYTTYLFGSSFLTMPVAALLNATACVLVFRHLNQCSKPALVLQ